MMLVSKMEIRSIETLKPFPRNPKKHPEEQIDKICSGIKEFGFLVPILIDADGEIIAGHGRLLAAQKLKMAEVPVILVDHLTPTQVKAFRIADNKLNESPWDYDMLTELLGEINQDGGNMDALGFDEAEINRMLDSLLSPESVGDGRVPTGKIDVDEPDTRVTIGKYWFSVPWQSYVIWIENLKQDVGFDDKSVVDELRRRLGC